MDATVALDARLVLSDGSVDPEAGRAARLGRAAVPMIIGLVAPILIMMVIDPAMLKHLHSLVVGVLIPALLIAVGIYAYSVLSPGEVCGIVIDAATRKVRVVQANAFATRVVDIPFAAITEVRPVSGYDRDGYAARRTELITRRNEQIPLPDGTTDAEVAALKQLLGAS